MADDMDGLQYFADAVRKLTWGEMAQISQHLASEIPHLIKSEALDRDGVAQSLVELAKDICNRPDPKQASDKEQG